MTRIDASNLSFRYHDQSEWALEDVSLSVDEGEFLGVVGETGAGKTTLLSAMCGIVPFQTRGTREGRVTVGGKPVTEFDSVDQLAPKISMVLQNPENQLFNLRVFDEVIWGPENLSLDEDEIVRRAREALELFGLEGFEDRITYNLSGGEKQKVAIASVYAMNPDVILLDEPTSQLDPIGTEMVFDAIDQLIAEGVTIVMVEHKVEELAAYADRIAVLEAGKLREIDDTASILTDGDSDVPRPQVTELGRTLNREGASVEVPLTLERAATEFEPLFRRYGDG